MNSIKQYRHIYASRSPRLLDQPNDVAQLQELFPRQIPAIITDFLTTFSDCMINYAFHGPTKSGRSEKYSHFVATNIGPDLPSYYPFPSSLISRIQYWREWGLQNDALPLVANNQGQGKWLFCRILEHRAPIVVARGDRDYGTNDREWSEISADFPEFIEQLSFDITPYLWIYRRNGTSEVDESDRELFSLAMGVDWEAQIQEMCKRKHTKSAQEDEENMD